eukprot:scaffold13560_cov122-Alexandrium_tamarense.AAC.7
MTAEENRGSAGYALSSMKIQCISSAVLAALRELMGNDNDAKHVANSEICRKKAEVDEELLGRTVH